MRQVMVGVLFTILLFIGPAVIDVQSYDTGNSDWLEEDAQDWQRTYEPTNVPNNQQSATVLPTPVTPTVNQQQIVVQPQARQRTRGRGILSIIFPWLAREQNTGGSQQSEAAVPQSRQTAVQPGLTQPLQPNHLKPSAGEQGAYSPVSPVGSPSGLIRPRIGSPGPGSYPSSYVVDLRKQQPSTTQAKKGRAKSPGTQTGLIKPTIQGSKPRR